jgi:AcrR family transcriptional regulator
MPQRVDGRRTDTRERIRVTALEMFTTQGYELTTLAQVADRLGITRPAVYHHFRSKEDLLTSSYGRLLPALEELVAFLRTATPPRAEALRELSALLHGEDGLLLVCARVNEHAVRGIPAATALLDHLEDLTRLLAPGADVDSLMRGRLAVNALVMAAGRGDQLGGTTDQRSTAALTIASELLGIPATPNR